VTTPEHLPNVHITGWGKYLPERVLTNRDLETFLDTSDEWIRTRTGIGERHLAATYETASTMALQAARQALERAGLKGPALDLIICCSVTPESWVPPCACVVQDALGAARAGAFDLNATCTGFVYGLAVASQFLRAGTLRRALVIGVEVLSRAVDWKDRSTAVLFGDGAGAVVLEASEAPGGVLSSVLGSDGSKGDLLYLPTPFGSAPLEGPPTIRMAGPEVYKEAVRVMERVAREATAKAGITPGDIDLLVPHQANERIIMSAAEALGIDEEKVFLDIERYGNTSAASIPIALCEAADQGRVLPGDRVLLVGFGGGFTWGAVTLEWTAPVPALATGPATSATSAS
jgi:3-oxoacyl-[acyl-carrier-protein] synthase-3